MRSTAHETLPFASATSTGVAGRQVHFFFLLAPKAFEKDPVGFRVWQEGCSQRLECKGSIFYLGEESICFILTTHLCLCKAVTYADRTLLWFLAFLWKERGGRRREFTMPCHLLSCAFSLCRQPTLTLRNGRAVELQLHASRVCCH